jgi:hypothetical protein
VPDQKALERLKGALIQALRNSDGLVHGTNTKPIFEVLWLCKVDAQAQQVMLEHPFEASGIGVLADNLGELLALDQ